jgi:hypothetical protein
MLENLKTSLPPDRWPPLELQLQVLDRAVARAFPDPEGYVLGDNRDSMRDGPATVGPSARGSSGPIQSKHSFAFAMLLFIDFRSLPPPAL